jgi:hypothetical protein
MLLGSDLIAIMMEIGEIGVGDDEDHVIDSRTAK